MKSEKVELQIGSSKKLTLETGHLAKEADGSVVLRLGDTMLLSAATAASKPREGIDFFPLMVEFEEKLYAIGRIPGGFFKREGRPSESSILNSRKVDRPIRPLFPEGFRNDVQVVVSTLAFDNENPYDVLGIIAASAALSISDIPFDGPIGAVRVGIVDGKIILNPTMEEMRKSTLDLVFAGDKERISMIEAEAKEVSEADMLAAFKAGHEFVIQAIKLQEELVKKAGKKKKTVAVHEIDKKMSDLIHKSYKGKVESAMKIMDKDKQADEMAAIELSIKDEMEKNVELKEIYAANSKDVKKLIEDIEYDFMRNMVLNEGKRIDGRKLDEIREISCEIGVIPRAHGSAIFSRGQTQVLCIATLGSAGEEQRLEGLDVEETGKRYMHHYNFPAYSVGEVKPLRGPGRREIGHGALAEKALVPVLPAEDKFPYTIRLVSEVLGSNGST